MSKRFLRGIKESPHPVLYPTKWILERSKIASSQVALKELFMNTNFRLYLP